MDKISSRWPGASAGSTECVAHLVLHVQRTFSLIPYASFTEPVQPSSLMKSGASREKRRPPKSWLMEKFAKQSQTLSFLNGDSTAFRIVVGPPRVSLQI